MRLMANPELEQRRLDWLVDDEKTPPHLQNLRTAEQSDTVLFTGCLPYYQVLFGKIGAQGTEIARSAVKVLNHLNVEPVVLADEVCCGHDLLWEGETDTFRRLVEINTERLQATGAKRIVTTCPECAITLKRDYQLDMPVLHIAELLAAEEFDLDAQRLDWGGPVTYQDPCRLGRHMDVYEEPRQVIEALGLELAEMENNRGRAICCGTSAWTHCGATAKSIQVDRLREARATGAETLVTTCAKCQIHFKCAQNDPRLEEEIAIEIKDLTSLVAYAISQAV
jgi:Fe-S oxidoreductase